MRHSGSDDEKKTTHLNSGMKDLRYPPNATATVEAVTAPPIRIRRPTPNAAQSDLGNARLTSRTRERRRHLCIGKSL